MARQPNYDFEKRKKEQERKAKTEAKRAARQQRRDDRRGEGSPEPQPPESDNSAPDAPATETPEQSPGA